MLRQYISFYKGLICLITIALLFSCATEKKPDRLLSEEEMTQAIIEFYVNEEKINRLNLRRDSAEKFFEMAKPILFKNIGVSDTVFRESFEYYAARPVILERIYTIVVDSLSLREQRLTVTPSSSPAPQ